MSWLSKLLGKWSHKSEQISAPTVSAEGNSLSTNWRSGQKAYIIAAEQKLKYWIVGKIQKDNSLDFTWESGNDESFLDFLAYTKEEEDNYADLDMYLTYKLDIPDAGEFAMTGQGKLYIQDNRVWANYSSEMRELIDFNEETEEEIYGEAEEESNTKELFAF